MSHILVVDDDPMLRTISKMALKRDGWTVSQAGSGAEALELYESSMDMVLLDLMMPDMDGREVLAALQAVNPKVRAVFITARHDVDSELLGLGALAVLKKPYDPLTLGEELRKIIE